MQESLRHIVKGDAVTFGFPLKSLLLDHEGGLARVITVDGQDAGLVAVFADGELVATVLPPYAGRGVATRALQSIIAMAFADKGFSAVRATTQIGRPGSSLALKIGLQEICRSISEISFELSKADWDASRARPKIDDL